MRKVIIGTPSYDGKVDAHYLDAMVRTVKMSPPGVEIFPYLICYDGLVQRARNDIVKMAIDVAADDLIFMDADQEWNPEWIFRLLSHPVDVVGGTVIKKSDVPAYNVKVLPTGLVLEENGLMEVACVGTGFLRLSRNALVALWAASEEYSDDKHDCKMVFDLRIINRSLVSEDNAVCEKWRGLGGKVWIDPTMTCNHIGVKKYVGNFMQYIQSFPQNGK